MDSDSILDIAFKELTNLKDPLTVILFCAQGLKEIKGCEGIGEEILEQTKRSLKTAQRLFDELKVKAVEIRSKGEELQRIGQSNDGKIVEDN